MHVEGAVALVTGANRGLGEAFTKTLIARGARTVYAGAREPGSVADPTVIPVKLDITNSDEVIAAASHCSDATLVINNAVLVRNSPFIAAPSMTAAEEEMRTNYFGTLAMCRAFAPVLGANGGGALVNMLSIVAFFNLPTMGSFCATKAALWSLTNGVRIELRRQGTLVTGAHAAFIDTRQSASFGDVAKHDPMDVANLILDAVEAGKEEVLADERTRGMKAALPRDLELIYPEVERQFWDSDQLPA